jgi:hypothetical protein
MLHKSLPSQVGIAIDDTASAILEEVLDALTSEPPADLEDFRMRVQESRAGEGGACDLDTDHQLDLLECHAEDAGVDFVHPTSFHDLRVRIEEAASAVLMDLAREQATEALQELERFVDDQGLESCALLGSNPYASARHFAESDEGSCHVYHYRNVEGIHVDVLEFELGTDHTVFLIRPVDSEDLTAQELTFDAT